jgi:predicted nucleic acid-binding protein
MILLDTNIFLEMLSGQEKAEDCEKLLKKISNGSVEAVVTRFSIHAIEAILGKVENVASFLRNVEGSIGLQVYETDTNDELAAALMQSKTKLDFDDSIQFYVARKIGVSSIVSFDKHFDNLDVKRTTPSQYLT